MKLPKVMKISDIVENCKECGELSLPGYYSCKKHLTNPDYVHTAQCFYHKKFEAKYLFMAQGIATYICENCYETYYIYIPITK